MMPRGAPYISWTDLFTALARVLMPGDLDRPQRRVEARWAPNTVACLSIRSGFDAALRVLAFPPGSEIVVSAITIPHLLDIIAHHGLLAVPVDLDLDTLAVHAADVAQAISANTKAILITHLFGGRNPIDDLVALTHDRDLLLFEDCAQAYDGRYRGHPASDVRMFSFGPIKRQTALGGALLTFSDARHAAAVRRLQSTYPPQLRRSYARRIATMAAIKAVMWKPAFRAFASLSRQLGLDHDTTLGAALRAFSSGDLFTRIRQQPSAPLLHLLERRLRQSADASIAKRSAVVDGVKEAWPGLPHPGKSMAHRNPWLFPTLSPDPERLMEHLWRHGFDATRGASNLVCTLAPPGRAAAERAEQFLKEVLFLPLHPEAAPADLRGLAEAIRQYADDPAAEDGIRRQTPPMTAHRVWHGLRSRPR